ncbi:MAG: homoserine O-succinyltransferase [Robiginitomaculum sp.]|nr:homoserine O-succinyltransferase [Robiginitomaculum sp.]
MAQDVEICLGNFALEHGGILKDDIVQGRLYGPAGPPLVVVPGGISASRFVADGVDGKDGSGGWWSDMIYPGGPIDLNQVQVLGFDCAPGSSNAENRLTITTGDQAKRLVALLDHLKVERVHSIIGMSYGGMIALAFAQEFPARVENLCIFGAAHRPWPMGVALRGIQRRTIDMATKLGDPLEGLKLARELAMTTYRSAEEFSERFSAAPSGDNPATFDVGDYLESRGRHYKNIMPVNRFLALSESIDLHRVDPAKISARTTLIAVKSDQLAPPSEMQVLCDALAGTAELHVIDSIYGHDSFLKATDLLAPILTNFMGGKSRAA